MVADPTADDDTTYTALAASGATDTFQVQPVDSRDAILFSGLVWQGKDTSGTPGLASVAREAGTDTVGSAIAPGAAYTDLTTPVFYQTAPSGTPWTPTTWNAMEWGYQQSGAGAARVTQFLAIAVTVPDGTAVATNPFTNEPTIDLIWVRLYDRTTTAHLVAEVALPDRDVYFNGFKNDLITDVGEVDRTLSDRYGQPQVPSFTFSIFDRDGTWRALAADPSTRDFTGMVIEYYGNTDAGRRAETTPRTIFRGKVREHHWQADLVLQFVIEDPLSAILANNTNPAQLPKRTVSTTDFANCAAEKVASSAEGYVVDGAHAIGATTITIRSGVGQFASADQVQFASHATIYPVSSSSKTGLSWEDLTAPETAETSIVLQTPLTHALADGEAIAQFISHTITPAQGTRVPFAYGLISDFKIIGGEDNGDGQGPLRYVGDKVLADNHTYGEFVWTGHACYAPSGQPFQGLYFFNNPIDLTVEAATGGRAAVAGYSNWTSNGFSSSFVTYGGRDYTVLYLRGVLRDWALGITQAPPNTGGVQVAVNAYGHQDVDGSLLCSGPRVYRHALKNYILGDYQGGAFLDAPTYPDGTSYVNDASFGTVEAQQQRRVTGGCRLDFLIGANGSTITVPDLIAQLNIANDCESGFNNDIQAAIWMAEDDPTRAAATADTLDDVNDILDESGTALGIDDQDLNLFNAIQFGHTPDYLGRDASGWRSTETGFNEVYHPASVSVHGKVYDQPLSLFCVRGKNRSSDVDDYQQGTDWVANLLAHRLRRTAEAPRLFTVPTGMRGFNGPFELGSTFYLVSGKDIGGRTPRLVRILGIKGQAGSTPQGRVVTFLAEDQTRLLSDALSITFALGAVDSSHTGAVPSLGSLSATTTSAPVTVAPPPAAVDRLTEGSLATPANLVDGQAWVECAGTSPNRVAQLKVRDVGGAVITIATVTY